jgi:hypothetical protein
LKGFGTTRFHPWVMIQAFGSMDGVPLADFDDKIVAEMVRAIDFAKTPKTCFSASLEKDAYCPYSDTCAPACLCVEPDPWSGSGCLSWLDEWSCPGTTNPFGKCF